MAHDAQRQLPSPAKHRNPRIDKRALRITLIYAVFGSLWIISSDLTLEWFAGEHAATHLFQTAKGILYVLATSALVYWLAQRGFKSIRQKVLAEQLDETENLLKTVTDNIEDAVFIVGPPHRTIRTCNAALTSVFGYEPDEIIGARTEVLHVDRESFQYFGEMGEPVLEERGIFQCCYKMKRKNGAVIDTEITVITLHQEFGWRKGAVSIIRDITEKVQTRKALQKSEEQYRLLAENTLDVIWTMNADLEFTYVNPAIERLTGYTQKEFTGTRLAEHCSKETFAKLLQVIEQETAEGAAGQGVVAETELLDRNRSPVPVEIHGRVIFDKNGTVQGFQGTARDITERRQAERALEKYREHLEEEVRERTERLQTLVNSMAGREVRMAELKKVNEKLRAQLVEAGLTPAPEESSKKHEG